MIKIWCDEPGKLVLISPGPTEDTDGHPPFSGRFGRTVAELAGVRHGDLCKHFALANLFDEWQGPSRFGNGDAFPTELARSRAHYARKRLRRRKVVLFGANLTQAFQLEPPQLLTTFRTSEKLVVAYVPHPLGVPIWWADRTNQARVRIFLEGLVGVRWGIDGGSIPSTARHLNEIE